MNILSCFLVISLEIYLRSLKELLHNMGASASKISVIYVNILVSYLLAVFDVTVALQNQQIQVQELFQVV